MYNARVVAAQDLHKKMFNECDRVIKLTGGGMALFTSSGDCT